MPEVKERKISPAIVIIPIGLGLAVVGALAAMAWAAPPAPPPGLANLYGVVTDAETGYALEGVKVTLDGLITYTDSLGRYAFEGLTPGSYSIEFSKDGYETLVR